MLITFVSVSNAFRRLISELIPAFSALRELCSVMLRCFAVCRACYQHVPCSLPQISTLSVNAMEYEAFVRFRYQSLCCWKNNTLGKSHGWSPAGSDLMALCSCSFSSRVPGSYLIFAKSMAQSVLCPLESQAYILSGGPPSSLQTVAFSLLRSGNCGSCTLEERQVRQHWFPLS